ncbi:MAG: hypothetical protein WC260_01690 [Candidatus Pacearchaeota archaeon]
MVRNSVKDLFAFEEDKVSNEDEVVLIFDGHNLAHKTVFTASFHNPDDTEFRLWKHQMIGSILYTIDKFKPNKVVFAFDGKRSWRYDIYPNYKANRKANRAKQKQTIDFDAWYPIFNSFVEDLKKVFCNTYVLQIPNCEADDVMAVLSRDVFSKPGMRVINITNDSDMIQLTSMNHVSQYDGKKLVKCIDPKKEIELKVLTGDISDNILGIKYGVGKVTAEKILKSGLDNFIITECNKIVTSKDVEKVKKQWRDTFEGMDISAIRKEVENRIRNNYKLNTQLIKFDHIPIEIKQRIINTFNEYELMELDSKKVVDFFIKNKMVKHLDSWNNFSDLIKSLG